MFVQRASNLGNLNKSQDQSVYAFCILLARSLLILFLWGGSKRVKWTQSMPLPTSFDLQKALEV